MAFLDGLKNLKVNELVGAAASKVQEAKQFVDEKSDVGPLKNMKDQVGGLASKAGSAVSSIAPAGLSKYLPTGTGKRQSPIDLITSEAKFDETLGDGQFSFKYQSGEAKQLVNSGYSLQVNFVPGGTSSVTALHLDGEYILKQVHLHWGTEPMNGSEHMIGGVGYAGEIQMVHAKQGYGEVDDSLGKSDGLAIFAIFLNETHDDNPALNPIISHLDTVKHLHEYAPLDRGFDARALIPDKMEFWTYDGSLTMPPNSECAIWTVFRASIPISTRQLEKLRQAYAVTAEQVVDNPMFIAGNSRPPQPTHGRLIRASFRAGGVVTDE